MRGEHNKKWNKRVTRPCPVCGGRVIVANRNQSWWIRCDDDPFHIKYKPYEDPYSAIRAFNAQTNGDKIRAMTDEQLNAWFMGVCHAVAEFSCSGCQFEHLYGEDCGFLAWLKQADDGKPMPIKEAE